MAETYEVNGERYTQEIKEVAEQVAKGRSLIVGALSRAVKEIAKTIQSILDRITGYRAKKTCDYNWIVPLDMTKTSQIPKMPNLTMTRARSHI